MTGRGSPMTRRTSLTAAPAKAVMGKKALIAMSGGVGFFRSPLLTKQAGYDCIRCYHEAVSKRGYWSQQSKDLMFSGRVEGAGSVARRLGIPYYVFNFSRDFKVQVIDRFAAAYESGATRTPVSTATAI